MTTISDDILLRILEVSPGVSPNGFPLNEIRIHCKNYFDHMTVTWGKLVKFTILENSY